MPCSPRDSCSSRVFILFGFWGVLWGLGPLLHPVKLSFSSHEMESFCLQSQVTASRLTPWGCARGTPGDVPYGKWRGSPAPSSTGHWMWLSSFRRKIWLISPQTIILSMGPSPRHCAGCPPPGQQIHRAPPRQPDCTAAFNYTAVCFFHILCQGSIKVACKTKSGFSLTSSDFFPTETTLVVKVGMYLHTFTQPEYRQRNMHAVPPALQ